MTLFCHLLKIFYLFGNLSDFYLFILIIKFLCIFNFYAFIYLLFITNYLLLIIAMFQNCKKVQVLPLLYLLYTGSGTGKMHLLFTIYLFVIYKYCHICFLLYVFIYWALPVLEIFQLVIVSYFPSPLSLTSTIHYTPPQKIISFKPQIIKQTKI